MDLRSRFELFVMVGLRRRFGFRSECHCVRVVQGCNMADMTVNVDVYLGRVHVDVT